jgi:DNA-directed RNA polymerase specialized sigma24 family protein
LPMRQRTVLVLRFYADASDADIAQALGCRRGTVRSLASRGLATLRTDPTITEGGTR